MNLHDRVNLDAALASAAYLLERARNETQRAWQIMIENGDYRFHAEMQDADAALSDARVTLDGVQREIKREEGQCIKL